MGRALLVVVAFVATGCGHELDIGAPADPEALTAAEREALPTDVTGSADDAGADDAGADDAGADDAGADDDAGTAPGQPGTGGTGADGASGQPGQPGQPGTGGTAAGDDDAPAPAGPPPADAGQTCTEWTDCGPRFANPNSGFDCLNNTCTCNAEGNWDDACASIGGFWSDEECFCFVSTSPAPAEDADQWTADEEEDPAADRQCWWVWKERCEPDRWVDTAEYEWVCRGDDDCGYEYRAGGYWESGECNGYWIRRCDDGTEKRYGP